MTTKNKEKSTSSVKKIVFAVLALLVIGFVALYLNLGSIAKTIAEKVGSETMGVKVSIGKIDIDGIEKSVTISNIKIANPDGYSKPYAMKLGLINIALDSFSKELLVFNDVSVKDAEIFLEVNKNGTNLSALKKYIDQNTSTSTDAKKEVKASTEAPEVILKHFLLSGTQLHPTVTLIGGDLKTVTLPDIKLTGVGEKQGGTSARSVIAKLWTKISSTAIKSSTSAGFLQGISTDSLKNIAGDTEKSLNKASESLKGLFN